MGTEPSHPLCMCYDCVVHGHPSTLRTELQQAREEIGRLKKDLALMGASHGENGEMILDMKTYHKYYIAFRPPTPEVGAVLKCLVCAYEKPWGIWDGKFPVAVCADCRDKANHFDYLQQQLAQSQTQYRHLETLFNELYEQRDQSETNFRLELTKIQRERDALQLRLNEAVGLLTLCLVSVPHAHTKLRSDIAAFLAAGRKAGE
jgi:hypothetical protein